MKRSGERGKGKGERKTGFGLLLSLIVNFSPITLIFSTDLFASRAGLPQLRLQGKSPYFVGAASRRDKKSQFLTIEEPNKSVAVLLLSFIFNLSPFPFPLSPAVP